MENNFSGGIAFDMPKNRSNVIKVIGVGGGGSNAINYMFQQGINGVDFVICNTDAQALQNSPIPNKIQLGVSLTEGLGAGANPEVGEQAAIESSEEIVAMLQSNTKLVFITAGMGGGTGTGAAPVIANMARELDILTVGIVTIPFGFEGKMRNEQAQLGVEKLRANVDSLIVINNNKLRDVYGNLGFKAGFAKADEVLATASRGIAEVITHHYTQNIDLRDAKTVLSNSGTAIMGSANAAGDQRANLAISKALDSPLLNDNKINGAKNVLLLIVSGKDEITIDEIGEINDYIQQEAGYGANIIMGVGDDESLDDAIAVTVIATGFNSDQQEEFVSGETKKIIHNLNDDQKAEQDLSAKNTGHVSIPKIDTTPIEVVAKKEDRIVVSLEEGQEIVETPVAEVKKVETPVNIVEDTIVNVVEDDLQSFETLDAEDDFVIIDVESAKDIEIVDAEQIVPPVQEEQMALTFDFPMSGETAKPPVVEEETPVVDSVSYQEEEVIRYTLEDEEDSFDAGFGFEEKSEPIDELENFQTTIKQEAPVVEAPKKQVPEAPLSSPISELLKARAEKRKMNMKEFNYKFRNGSAANIDELEKEPAWKRQGLDLQSREEDTKISRTSVSTDSNGDIQIRKNNSFLHDNVD